jgi:hypothetical protein
MCCSFFFFLFFFSGRSAGPTLTLPSPIKGEG